VIFRIEILTETIKTVISRIGASIMSVDVEGLEVNRCSFEVEAVPAEPLEVQAV
jgi:hypothetical protein